MSLSLNLSLSLTLNLNLYLYSIRTAAASVGLHDWHLTSCCLPSARVRLLRAVNSQIIEIKNIKI